MKLVQCLASQAIRLIDASVKRADGNLPAPKLARAIEEKYGFFQGPRVIEDYDLSKGVVFLHCEYRGQIIDKLSIFNDGIVCDAKGPTELSDDFVDDVLETLRELAGLDSEAGKTRVQIYMSRLEVHSELDVGKFFLAFSEFGKSVASSIRGYGQNVNDYVPSGLSFHYDWPNPKEPRPPAVTFERREGVAYGENIYFSSAPLRTNDHLKHLMELEMAFGLIERADF